MPIVIRPIAGTDIRLVSGDWPMPQALRRKVPEVWALTKARTPDVWDGRILGFSIPVLSAEGVLRSEAREDAYSAFLTWRATGFPDIGVVHIFSAALILSSDGALIYGVMGGDTINAGRVYPPGGSIESRDVRPDGQVDVEGSIAHELWEETGLRAADAEQGPLLAVFDGPRICVARVLLFNASAAELVASIRVHLSRQAKPELADVVACRRGADARAAGDLADYAAALLDDLPSLRTTRF